MEHMKHKSLNPRDRAKEEEAVGRVFNLLEKRWRQELGGRKIPHAHRQKMRRDPAFKQLVDRALHGAPLVFTDYEQAPAIAQRLDGTVTNAFEEELAGNPLQWFCPECGHETETQGEPCVACKDFRPELRQ